jgi:hypothetical protein
MRKIIDGRTYAISHGWQHVPIHLVGCETNIGDRIATLAANSGPARTVFFRSSSTAASAAFGVSSPTACACGSCTAASA